jgi:hypothetical protein
MNSHPALNLLGLGDSTYPPYPQPQPRALPAPSLPAAPPVAPPPATPVPPVPSVSRATLQAGHRYQILQLAPVPDAPVFTAEQAQALFDAIVPGALRVVSVTPATGAHPTAAIVDAVRDTPMVLPSTMPLTDLGPAPVPPAPPPPAAPTQPPVTPVTFVFSPGEFPQAISAAPGTPVSVSLPPGGSWQSLSFSTLGSMPGSAQPLVQPGSTAPVTVAVPPGPATIAATWTDSSGAMQPGAAIFLPPGATLSTPITDPAVVTAVQNMLNDAAAASGAVAPVGGPVLQPVPVNGNASDPAFAAQLAAFQQWLVGIAATPPSNTIAPSIANIPTNGALDYATLAALSLPL